MYKNIFLYALLLTLLTSCNAQQSSENNQHKSGKMHSKDGKKANKLIHESSPYLLQHAYNPVEWHPWGEEALKKAKDEDKLLIISVGYAACHWCHVMEHESFEDSSVAKLMNDAFVPIKVDREERPDVDQIYMDAAHMINGRGGWPLNAIALPNGQPIFAGTYYPKDRWMKILDYFAKAKKENFAALEQQANQITMGIQTMDMIPLNEEETEFTKGELNDIFAKWMTYIDFKNGGRKSNSNKFPMPNNFSYLLKYHHLSKNQKALDAVTVTLDNMAMGGIYDHAGGGFARYSTDPVWHVPHFEKMLYDNGQLISLYAQAYQLTKKPLYKKTVYETLEFIERELTSKENGFYSSLDADSEGVEGKFYLFTKKEIEKFVGEDAAIFSEYYNITEKGNWEHSNILHRSSSDEEVAKQFDISVEVLQEKLEKGKKALMAERKKRIRPGLDNKILTSWNALMLKGYVDAYRVFDEPKFLEIALKNANFITSKCLQKNNRLNRNYMNGKSSINAFLDDYALTIDAFISLYQATFDEKWLNIAKDLMGYAQAHFYDAKSQMFFYTSDLDNPLIARKMEVSDNVIPASNSVMANNLFLLGTYFYNKKYIDQSKQMLVNVKSKFTEQMPSFFSNWINLMYYFANEPYEVAIVGSDFEAKRKALDEHYLPNMLLLGGKNEGSLELLKNKLIGDKTMIYVCQNRVCKFPVEEVKEALPMIR